MKTKLQRQHWVFIGLLLIIGYQIGHHIWLHWGLITVHSKNTPLAQVIRSIEKQGHVTIKTNIDPNKPVAMNVDEVTLNEAMETLATTMECRWRLTYVVGPDKAAVNGVLASFEAGQRDEAWKHLYVPLPPIGDESNALADPRKDLWAVKPASEQTLQAYLQQAAKNVAASFWVQEAYNPPVKSAPSAGKISKSLPKLASAANSKYAEVILLQGSTREADRDRDRDDGEPRFAGNFGGDRRGFDRSAMDERIENELAKLPPADRATAQAERDQRKAFFDSLKDLTPEQRAQRFQDMMNDPNMQDRMDNQMNQRNNRMSQQQREQRAQNYLQRMAQSRSAAGKQ